MTCCGKIAVGLAEQAVPADLQAKMGRSETVVRHCDVCFLLEGDTTPKETKYCRWCDKFMCEKCRTNHWRRAGAAVAFHMRTLLKEMRKGFQHGNSARMS